MSENKPILLSEFADNKGLVIFSPVAWNEDGNGNITILCSLNNTYVVPADNKTFIEHFKSIFSDMENERYSLACSISKDGILDCFVM